MTAEREMVTVPPSLLEKARNRIHVLGVLHADPRHYIANEAIYLPELDAALASSGPEGGARTERVSRDWRKALFTYEHDETAGHLYYFAPQTTAPGPFLQQRHVQAIVDIASDGTFAGVELIDSMPPLNSERGADTKSGAMRHSGPSDPLTKTPSADHDAGNLRTTGGET